MNPRIRATTALARVPSANDFLEHPTQNLRLEIISGEQSQARAAVIDYRGQRLIDLVGYGRCQFAHGCQSGNPGKLRLRHVQCLLCFLPIVQIHDAPKPLMTRPSRSRNGRALEIHQRYSWSAAIPQMLWSAEADGAIELL